MSMSITISSVITMCILNSVLILVLCLISKTDVVMANIGPGCITMLLLVIIIRMFFPFEFPYTHSIYMEDLLMTSRRGLTYIMMAEPVEIRVWHILVTIWLLGSVVMLIKKCMIYCRFIHFIKLLPELKWETLCKQYGFDTKQYAGMEKVKIVRSQLIPLPYVVGLRKPYLALPETEYEKRDFHYIILHEFMHVRYRDTIWKILIDLLCIVFWWNPVFYFVKKELFQIIELRNDMRILSVLKDDEKVDYMKCLKSMAVKLCSKDMPFGVAFNRSDLKELDRRMRLMVNDNQWKRSMQVVLSITVCAVLFLTSTIIFEPYSFENSGQEGIVLTNENTFLVENGNAYDVYMEGEYIFTIEDLMGFEDIKIYNNIKEAEENE